MDEYGGSFGVPPPDAYENVWIMKIDSAPSLYAVDAELWDEAGRATDLTVQLAIQREGHAAIIEIADVRVM